MLLVAVACLLLISLTTLLHYEVLRGMNGWLPALRIPNRSKLLAVMFAAFAAHILEICLYGAAVFALIRYAGLGSLNGGDGATLINCLYFSAETYSSLGFGDLIPTGPIRLLAGTEALNGLLLIGWSASFVYIAMERFWRVDSGASPTLWRPARARLKRVPAIPASRPCAQTAGRHRLGARLRPVRAAGNTPTPPRPPPRRPSRP